MTTAFLQVKNRAFSTIAGDIDNSSDPVIFSVAGGDGALFPATSGGSFNVTIDSEILTCTSRTTDSLTCTRASEGTTIAAHSSGATISLNVTAQSITDLNTAVNALEGGIAGNLDNTAGGTDALTTKAPTSNVMYDHNAAVISSTVHNNTTLCKVYLAAAQNDVRSTGAFRIQLDTVSQDTAGNFKLPATNYWANDVSADNHDCTSVNIHDAGHGLTAGQIRYVYITWTDSAGANPGTGYVTAVTDIDNIAIVKNSGADFTNSGKYTIRYSHYLVPSSGWYLIVGSVAFGTTVDGKYFGCQVFSNGDAVAAVYTHASGTSLLIIPIITVVNLTAGAEIILLGDSNSGSSTLDLIPGIGYTYLSIMMLAGA